MMTSEEKLVEILKSSKEGILEEMEVALKECEEAEGEGRFQTAAWYRGIKSGLRMALRIIEFHETKETI